MTPLILCIETAMSVCSVALFEGEQLLSYAETEQKNSAAEFVNLFIEETLHSANKKIQDLQAVAVSGGPGSYTGLRIGCATAKALAFSLQIPILHIDTTQILAAGNKTSHKNIITLIDARREDVFYAVYDAQLNMILPINFATITSTLFSHLESSESILVGDGAAKTNIVYQAMQCNSELKPLAKNMGILALKKWLNTDFEDTSRYEPKYHKEFFTTMKINVNATQ